VGPGTFKPVETDMLDKHTMHPEAYEIAPGAASGINHNRGKIWAVGTTVVRALESAAKRPAKSSAARNEPVYSPALWVQGRQLSGHELPSAALDVADAGVRSEATNRL
jgi:hypothetical protein